MLEIIDNDDIYYGINAISHNLLMCNRKLLLNGNGFILGVSGSGKSFASKMEIAMAALFTDDIIIVDPEREYAPLVSNLGGEAITLSASSNNHINAMDINNDFSGEDNPISIKSEFLISLFDQLLKTGDASVQVTASTVQAGDLCFLPSYSHVGIVVGKDTGGNILVIHCSSGANNVVVSTASSIGFTVFRRPNCY